MRSPSTSDSFRESRDSFRSRHSDAAVSERRVVTWRSFSSASGMTTLAIVDAGPLYAAADADDDDHAASRAALSRSDLRLVIPALVVAEAAYFVGRRLGSPAESAFLRGIGTLDVEAPTSEDFNRMADLVIEYGDFPLGGTDASVIALAERLSARIVVTLDRRHFGAVRPAHTEAFELLP